MYLCITTGTWIESTSLIASDSSCFACRLNSSETDRNWVSEQITFPNNFWLFNISSTTLPFWYRIAQPMFRIAAMYMGSMEILNLSQPYCPLLSLVCRSMEYMAYMDCRPKLVRIDAAHGVFGLPNGAYNPQGSKFLVFDRTGLRESCDPT